MSLVSTVLRDWQWHLKGAREALRRSWKQWASWVFIVAALSFSAWYGARSLAPARRVEEYASRVGWEMQRMRELRQDRIARLEYIPADDPHAVAEALRGGLRDPHAVLNPQATEALFRDLGAHLAARAAPDPSAYMALADREKTRWIGPEDSDDLWRLPAVYHEQITGRTLRRTEAREALRTALEFAWERDGMRITRLGVGEWGTAVYVGRTRERNSALVVSFPTPELDAYWDHTSTVATARYRVPVRSSADILRDNGSITYAIVVTVAESARGIRYPLVSRWYWDPQLGVWHCSSMHMKQVPAHAMWY